MLSRLFPRRLLSIGRLLAAPDSARGGSGDGPSAAEEYKYPWKMLKSEFEEDGNSGVPRQTDVLVVGGGAMGCSVAYWLRKAANVSVTILERDPTFTQAATPLSVGGVRQQFSEPENIRMSMFTAEFLRNIREHLSVLDHDPPDVNFCPHGYLVLASEQGADQLRANHRVQTECGADVELLSPRQLGERWPWLSLDGIALGSYGAGNEGWFDPWLLLSALRRKALALGVTIVHGELVGFDAQSADGHTLAAAEEDGDRASAVGGSGGQSPFILRSAKVRAPNSDLYQLDFSTVVDAAGPWARQVARLAGIGPGGYAGGLDLPVEPRRRSHFVVRCPPAGLEAPGIDAPWLVDPSQVNVRRKDLAGHFVVFQSEQAEPAEQEPDVDTLDVDYSFFEEHLWPALANRIPAMEEAKVRSAWAGFYDYNVVDQNLIIGNHPYHKNFIFCNGSSGHGIQHSLAIGRAVTELILFDEFKTIDLSRLSFDRFIKEEPIFEKNII